jgi:tRNA threonylcarbamoyladenosine biosynthesis protein TsaE
MFRLEIQSPDALDDAARELLDAFPRNRVFAFYGEMGVGKTTFIKALCRNLGVGEVTSSPSFGLIHEYRTDRGESVYHFDFYRIRTLEEAFDIGYEEYMYSGDYCFLEWPELAEALLPADTVRLAMSSGRNGARELKLMS